VSKLTTEERDKLPKSEFVFKKDRRYPIHDETHARAALAMVSKHGSPEEKEKVRRAVKNKYRNIEQYKEPFK
jgi:hypothetical protein